MNAVKLIEYPDRHIITDIIYKYLPHVHQEMMDSYRTISIRRGFNRFTMEYGILFYLKL